MSKEPPIIDFAPHVPTAESRQLVEQLAACDIDPDSICYVIKANPVELKLFYADELKHGLAACTAQMQSSVFRAGVAGDMKAATFWLRARAGWRETVKIEDTRNPQLPAQDKAQLIDRIVSMLTPAQAVEVLKGEGSRVAEPAAKPTIN
jgi:hypothetical protein